MLLHQAEAWRDRLIAERRRHRPVDELSPDTDSSNSYAPWYARPARTPSPESRRSRGWHHARAVRVPRAVPTGARALGKPWRHPAQRKHEHRRPVTPMRPVASASSPSATAPAPASMKTKGLPALQDWLEPCTAQPHQFEARLIPDEQATISATLIELVERRLQPGADHRRHRPRPA